MSQIVRKNISLSTGFVKAIHMPRYTHRDGDYPLYPHGLGSKMQAKRPENWYIEAESTYNSPSNVRVVCLSRDGANVLYWASPIKGNKLCGQLESAGKYVFTDTGKAEVGQSIDVMKFAWNNAGLKALVSPLVLSNLEELWIDAELLNCDCYRNYYTKLQALKIGQVVGVDFLAGILYEETMRGSSVGKRLADTFPLLRAIVVVKTDMNARVRDFHKCAVRTQAVKEYMESTYQGQRRVIGECPKIMHKLAQDFGFGFAVQPIATGDVLKFSLGDYKYDQKVLAKVQANLQQRYDKKDVGKPMKSEKKEESVKVDEIKEAEVSKDVRQEGSDTKSGELSEIIQDLEKEYSVSEVAQVLFAYKLTHADYFKEQVPLLSPEIREKYKSVFTE